MDTMAVEDIDGAFVPRRRAVPSVALDGETVLAGGPDGAFYRLDRVASLVWSCMDGSGTADQIAEDLAAELAAPSSVVAGDVVGLTRTLAGLGFLEGAPDDGATTAAVTLVAKPARAAAGVGRRVTEPPSG